MTTLRRILVAGDCRKNGSCEFVRGIGRLAHEEGDITFVLDSTGLTSQLLTGAACHCIVFHQEPGRNGAATNPYLQLIRCLSSGVQRDHLLDESDAFCFLPGQQGTVALVVDVIAMIMKDEIAGSARPVPRRVALLEWPERSVNALTTLTGISKRDFQWWITNCPTPGQAFGYVTTAAGPQPEWLPR